MLSSSFSNKFTYIMVLLKSEPTLSVRDSSCSSVVTEVVVDTYCW